MESLTRKSKQALLLAVELLVSQAALERLAKTDKISFSQISFSQITFKVNVSLRVAAYALEQDEVFLTKSFNELYLI